MKLEEESSFLFVMYTCCFFFSLVAVVCGGCDLGLFGDRPVALFANQRLVNVGDDAAAGNGRLDEGVQLFVSSDSKLQVTGSDTLHLQILGSVACQLKNLSCQVLEDGG